ncbi:MAG: phage BR0599 family protein [Rickettsiaceae bacterium]
MTNLIYIFTIHNTNGNVYHLTSCSQPTIVGNICYKSNSGLQIVTGEFNDSAENKVIIQGVFELGGIEQTDNLSGAAVKIERLYDNKFSIVASLICTKYISKDLEFEMLCEDKTIKYNQSLLQMFSKTCRASFGDNKCTISLATLAVQCELIQISGNILKCDITNIASGYFKGGIVMIPSLQKKISILSHSDNNIEIYPQDVAYLRSSLQVTLIPGCDKKYRTCCYSFNNAVNFRGEPAIPEDNIIEN